MLLALHDYFLLRITLVLENFATFSQSVLFKREKKKSKLCIVSFGNITRYL